MRRGLIRWHAVTVVAMLALGAHAFGQPSTQKCPATSFTLENFSKVHEGMAAADVSAIFQCQPAKHLTVSKGYAVQLFWTTSGERLKWVQIWFDNEDGRVERIHPAFDFKEKTGF